MNETRMNVDTRKLQLLRNLFRLFFVFYLLSCAAIAMTANGFSKDILSTIAIVMCSLEIVASIFVFATLEKACYTRAAVWKAVFSLIVPFVYIFEAAAILKKSKLAIRNGFVTVLPKKEIDKLRILGALLVSLFTMSLLFTSVLFVRKTMD